jgi:hypothetical protein
VGSNRVHLLFRVCLTVHDANQIINAAITTTAR